MSCPEKIMNMCLNFNSLVSTFYLSSSLFFSPLRCSVSGISSCLNKAQKYFSLSNIYCCTSPLRLFQIVTSKLLHLQHFRKDSSNNTALWENLGTSITRPPYQFATSHQPPMALFLILPCKVICPHLFIKIITLFITVHWQPASKSDRKTI